MTRPIKWSNMHKRYLNAEFVITHALAFFLTSPFEFHPLDSNDGRKKSSRHRSSNRSACKLWRLMVKLPALRQRGSSVRVGDASRGARAALVGGQIGALIGRPRAISFALVLRLISVFFLLTHRTLGKCHFFLLLG